MSVRTDANIDWHEVDERLADVDRRAKQLRPAFRKIRGLLRGDQRDHAKKEEGPESRWPPRAAATEERRRARNRGVRRTKAMRTIAVGKFKRRSTPKQILGRLPGAIAVTYGSLYARARSRAEQIGPAQQRGARVGRRRRVRLPPRVFLWLSDRLIEAARRTIADHVTAAAGGG